MNAKNIKYEIDDFVVVQPFIIQSSDAKKLIVHIISADLHKKRPHIFNHQHSNTKFVQVKDLAKAISAYTITSIKYKVNPGAGIKLPRIYSKPVIKNKLD